MIYVIAFLYGVVGVAYLTTGMVFSGAWQGLCALMAASTVPLRIRVGRMSAEVLYLVNPVLSAFIPSRRVRGYIALGVAALLLVTTWGLLTASVVGLIGVLTFSLLELTLAVVFYWPRDKVSAIIHYLLHSAIGALTIWCYWPDLRSYL